MDQERKDLWMNTLNNTLMYRHDLDPVATADAVLQGFDNAFTPPQMAFEPRPVVHVTAKEMAEHMPNVLMSSLPAFGATFNQDIDPPIENGDLG